MPGMGEVGGESPDGTVHTVTETTTEIHRKGPGSHTRVLAKGAPVTPSTETPTEMPGMEDMGTDTLTEMPGMGTESSTETPGMGTESSTEMPGIGIVS